MSLERKCKHIVLRYLGKQEAGKDKYFLLGNCQRCRSTVEISDKYKEFARGMYILKQENE